MFNWFLLIVCVVMFVMFTLATLYFIAYFQHEEDFNTAYLPKVVVSVTLLMAMVNIMMLPVDVANRTTQGGFPMGILWQVVYMTIAVLAIFIVPFALFYYESDDEKHQFITAVKWEVATAFVSGIVIGLLFFFLGIADVQFDDLVGSMGDESTPLSLFVCNTCTAGTGVVSIRVSFPIYVIACLSFLGWFMMVLFGGIGLAALPMDMLSSYKNRPRRIELEEYGKRKLGVKERVARLIDIGKKLQDEERNATTKKLKKRHRQAYNKFKTAVYLLERDYANIKIAYKERGGSPLKYWAFAVIGVVGTFISLAWILHVILYLLFPTPVTPFLNSFFVSLDRSVSFIGTIFYALFTFYLLWCVVKGNVKFGLRFFFFTIHPMKLKETLMNSMLVNSSLIMLCSVSVTQFAATSFDVYSRLTAVNVIFDSQVRNLRYLSFLWTYYLYALLIVAFLSFLYLIVFPNDRKGVHELDPEAPKAKTK